MPHEIDIAEAHAIADAHPIPKHSVQLDDVLEICATLGKVLQQVPAKERKFTVTRLRNKGQKCLQDGDPLGAMMFGVVAESWDDFSQ